MFDYTMYDADVFNIVSIGEDTIILTQNEKKYVWCRDTEKQ